MHETNRIDYKRELTADVDIEKEAIAFLNYHEGVTIHIGIDKSGKEIGVSDADDDALKIKDQIKNNIAPSAMGLFDVVIEERDNKQIIKIIVASGSEKPPEFKIFADRIEITSAGVLPEELSEEEFFEGFSIPRNRELMGVYRDLELVE